jgi:hypothetical protein
VFFEGSFDFAQDDRMSQPIIQALGLTVGVEGFRIFQRFSFQRVSVSKKISQAVDDLMADFFHLAPFGGITRIRFKGFVYDVSATTAPPLSSIYIVRQEYGPAGRRSTVVLVTPRFCPFGHR